MLIFKRHVYVQRLILMIYEEHSINKICVMSNGSEMSFGRDYLPLLNKSRKLTRKRLAKGTPHPLPFFQHFLASLHLQSNFTLPGINPSLHIVSDSAGSSRWNYMPQRIDGSLVSISLGCDVHANPPRRLQRISKRSH
jgi:hypothetical protein